MCVCGGGGVVVAFLFYFLFVFSKELFHEMDHRFFFFFFGPKWQSLYHKVLKCSEVVNLG